MIIWYTSVTNCLCVKIINIDFHSNVTYTVTCVYSLDIFLVYIYQNIFSKWIYNKVLRIQTDKDAA
jgi:hypothetical protein